jgi:hypothetical protein
MLTLLLVIGLILLILWLLGFSIGFLAGAILVVIWLARLVMRRR